MLACTATLEVSPSRCPPLSASPLASSARLAHAWQHTQKAFPSTQEELVARLSDPNDLSLLHIFDGVTEPAVYALLQEQVSAAFMDFLEGLMENIKDWKLRRLPEGTVLTARAARKLFKRFEQIRSLPTATSSFGPRSPALTLAGLGDVWQRVQASFPDTPAKLHRDLTAPNPAVLHIFDPLTKPGMYALLQQQVSQEFIDTMEGLVENLREWRLHRLPNGVELTPRALRKLFKRFQKLRSFFLSRRVSACADDFEGLGIADAQG